MTLLDHMINSGLVDEDDETLIGFYIRTMSVVEVVLLTIAAPAWIAHELMHYFAARWAQLHPTIRWVPFPACEYDVPAPTYVRLAPTIHGVLVFIVYAATRGVPELTPMMTLGLLWWAVYTYPSASDRNPVPVEEVGGGGT